VLRDLRDAGARALLRPFSRAQVSPAEVEPLAFALRKAAQLQVTLRTVAAGGQQ
jgi:hypothetical protein